MSALRRCDECGREFPEQTVSRYTLEHHALAPAYGDPPPVVDLCSLGCVVLYASKRIPVPWKIEMPALATGTSYADRCPCNPANGGSGVCNCVLGGPQVTC